MSLIITVRVLKKIANERRGKNDFLFVDHELLPRGLYYKVALLEKRLNKKNNVYFVRY